jgi:hypothetical protein
LTLVATDEPLDVGNPGHVARLRTLVTDLGLRELQERHRYDTRGDDGLA